MNTDSKLAILRILFIIVLLASCRQAEQGQSSVTAAPVEQLQEAAISPAVITEAPIETEAPADAKQETAEGAEIPEQREAVAETADAEVAGIKEISGETPAEEEQAGETVSVSIYCIDRYILTETETEFTEGQTVFDVLRQAARENGVLLDYKGKGAAVYILGIDNVYEFDRGPESGWLYRVNGAYAETGCGAFKVAEGDKIEWIYTEEMSENLF